MTETWRRIPGWRYAASDQGRVRTLPVVKKHHGKVTSKPGRLLRQTTDRKGYRNVKLSRNGDRRRHRVHVLVLEAFVGPRPDGNEICHRDGDKTNNRLTNIHYCTQSENMLDRVRHGQHHNAIKTHCPYGHPYTDENTYRPPNKPTTRVCVTCMKNRR